jgi:hypothetical protein
MGIAAFQADGQLETTERSAGGGQVTRTGRLEETRGQGHAIEVTVYGWQVLLLIDAVPKMPLAVTVGPLQAHEALWTRALVTQARLHLQGDARLHTVIFATGFWDGPTLWWLDQHAIPVVVPATVEMAVTVDARAQAATGKTSRSAAGCISSAMGKAKRRGASGWQPRWWGSRT